MEIVGIILCIVTAPLVGYYAVNLIVHKHRSHGARITTVRNLASIADAENHAYLNGDGRTGNALADARIQLFEALSDAEKPSDDAILNAVAVLEDPKAKVGKLADAIKYLNTGELAVPIRANEGWPDYCRRVEYEKRSRESAAQRHERVAAGIAAENKRTWGGRKRKGGIKFDVDAPLFTPILQHELTPPPMRRNDTLIADPATATVRFAQH